MECADGAAIYESNAIMYYCEHTLMHEHACTHSAYQQELLLSFLVVANSQLRGCSSDLTAALVQQYVSFADNEILPAACTWTFPTLGLMQYNKQVSRGGGVDIISGCITLLCIVGYRCCSGDCQNCTGRLKWSTGNTYLPSWRESDSG